MQILTPSTENLLNLLRIAQFLHTFSCLYRWNKSIFSAKNTHLLSSIFSITLCACSLLTLTRCPSFRAHSISACAQGNLTPSMAATQNCLRAIQPNPQTPAISSTGSATYVILMAKADASARRTTTRITTWLPRETIWIWRSGSPERVQWDQASSPSRIWACRPSQGVSLIESLKKWAL